MNWVILYRWPLDQSEGDMPRVFECMEQTEDEAMRDFQESPEADGAEVVWIQSGSIHEVKRNYAYSAGHWWN